MIHTDALSAAAAGAIDAAAYTVGSHIFFATGRFRPGSRDGDRLLAHELTHVVQQSAAGPSASPARLVQRDAPTPKLGTTSARASGHRTTATTKGSGWQLPPGKNFQWQRLA